MNDAARQLGRFFWDIAKLYFWCGCFGMLIVLAYYAVKALWL